MDTHTALTRGQPSARREAGVYICERLKTQRTGAVR